MKNKGFTLVELMAIIIILALVFAITIPIIQDLSNKSKRAAAVDSAYGYRDAVSKYFMSKQVREDIDLDGIYTVKDGHLSSNALQDTEISLKGVAPSSGYLRYKEGVLELGCLVINGYQVMYVDEEFSTEKKGDCSNDFATDSWKTIKSLLAADRSSYPLGAMRKEKMNLDGTERIYTLRLVNTSTPDECNANNISKSGCGVVIEFVTTIGEYPLYETFDTDNDINSGWFGSTLRTFLNTDENSVYNKLPDDLKEVIIPTGPIFSSQASGTESISPSAFDDYLYIEAPKELNTTTGYGCTSSCDIMELSMRTLDYYTNDGDRKKFKTSGEVTEYWTRSMNGDGVKDKAWQINTSGSADSFKTITDSYGIAPAFRILN